MHTIYIGQRKDGSYWADFDSQGMVKILKKHKIHTQKHADDLWYEPGEYCPDRVKALAVKVVHEIRAGRDYESDEQYMERVKTQKLMSRIKAAWRMIRGR